MIADADIARVISWHMLADMDCIITFTTKKALRDTVLLSFVFINV